MIRLTRPLVRLLVGLLTLAPAVIGSAAYATTGPDRPEPAIAPLLPQAGVSFWQQVAWMASGAGIVLLLAAAVAGIAVLSRRHTVHTRQLQMP